jgi:hypothetical protein
MGTPRQGKGAGVPMLDDERLGAAGESTTPSGGVPFDRLLELTFEDAVDRVRRHHPGAPRAVVELELAGELRLAGLPDEYVTGPRFHRAVDGLVGAAAQRSTER